jgi:hypothetical protein
LGFAALSLKSSQNQLQIKDILSMQKMLSALGRNFGKRFYAAVLAVVIGLVGWVAIAPQTSYAASDSTAQQAQTAENREQAYEEAKSIANDPEGLEKEYEKNREEYLKSHPDEGGVVQEAKQAVERITGNN